MARCYNTDCDAYMEMFLDLPTTCCKRGLFGYLIETETVEIWSHRPLCSSNDVNVSEDTPPHETAYLFPPFHFMLVEVNMLN